MPFVQLGDLRMHYALTGPAGAPLAVLSHSLGTNLCLWDSQLSALESRFRVLRYDCRGHGQSSVTPGPYSIEQLARDVSLLLDALGLERGHFCGISIGGLVGMWLGAHAPERIRKLVLCNTAARIGSAERWNARIESVRERGIQGIAPEVLERWFMPAFRTRRPELFAAAARMLEATAPDGYTASCAAIRDADLRESITRIHAPTLVIAGSHDPATPPAEGRWLADAIPGAQYLELPASHISNLEAPEQLNAELVRFLAT